MRTAEDIAREWVKNSAATNVLHPTLQNIAAAQVAILIAEARADALDEVRSLLPPSPGGQP